MAKIVNEEFVCECCMIWLENRDDSSCRDAWAHTHKECEFDGGFWVVGDEVYEQTFPITCKGCGQKCGAYATFYQIVEIR